MTVTKMSWRPTYRSSKFRNVYGKVANREHCFDGIPITKNVHDNHFCAVNAKFLAIVTESAGGGSFIVIPVSQAGRIDPHHPKVCGHQGNVLDIKWNPFFENIIASCSEDSSVRIWEIPEGGLRRNMTEAMMELYGHSRRVGLIEWHPTSSGILFSAGYDYKVLSLITGYYCKVSSQITGYDCKVSLQNTGYYCKVSLQITGYDCKVSLQNTGYYCKVSSQITGYYCKVSLQITGYDCKVSLQITGYDCKVSLQITGIIQITCYDCKVSLQITGYYSGILQIRYDCVSLQITGYYDCKVSLQITGYDCKLKNHRVNRVVFLGNMKRLTMVMNTRQISALWDQKRIDSLSGLLFNFMMQTHMLYLAGKGDGNIRYYEITTEKPYLQYLMEFRSPAPQKGLGVMPKHGLDVTACEVFRFYKLVTLKGLIEPISMIVPRRSETYQEDIYPMTAGTEPALSANDWLSGINRDPVLMSLKKGYQKPNQLVFKAPVKEKKGVVVNGIDLLENVPPRTENELLRMFFRQQEELRKLKEELNTKDVKIRQLELELNNLRNVSPVGNNA
ncbi:coronin-2B-like [Oncorhynchus nerka]|uniref:coronin-2B-like n=1 Tax=Oncorhynchus nerka TaxID=8023 RepID=UPI0031B82B98